jgi:hypothetical protein
MESNRMAHLRARLQLGKLKNSFFFRIKMLFVVLYKSSRAGSRSRALPEILQFDLSIYPCVLTLKTALSCGAFPLKNNSVVC